MKSIDTGQGFLFLAAVQGVFSRRIVGWSMSDNLQAELVLDTLGMAGTARGADTTGAVAHSAHGSQYVSLAYGAYAKQSGVDLSMGSIGDLWEYALAESFFASLEKTLLRREHFQTHKHARLRIFWYIGYFFNPRRRHPSLGMLSPVDYEQRHQQEVIASYREGVTGNGLLPRRSRQPLWPQRRVGTCCHRDIHPQQLMQQVPIRAPIASSRAAVNCWPSL